MKKIIVLVFGLLTISSLFNSSNVFAADASVCSGPYGCRRCESRSDDPDLCKLKDQINPPDMCAPDADPPANANEICANIIGDAGACNSYYMACEPRNTEIHSCVIQGTNPQCLACDEDPSTSTPDCPSGPDIVVRGTYNNSTICHTSCDIIDDDTYTCLRNGGQCFERADYPVTGCPESMNRSSWTCNGGPDAVVCCVASDVWTSFNAQIHGGCSSTEIDTAIGCLPVTNINDLAAFVLRWGLGIVGGIGFLMIIFASIMIITSTGDPKRLQAGRELLSAAIAGILILIFSVFILRFIGFNILQIPQFGS